MIGQHTSDLSELVGELFSADGIDYDKIQSALSSCAKDGGVICYGIMTLLSKQFPSLHLPHFDLAAMQTSPFEKALAACFTRGVIDSSDLTFFEKLVLCNAMFAFDCVDKTLVGEVCSSLKRSFSYNRHLMTLFLLRETEARHASFFLLAYTLLDLANRSHLLSSDVGSVREAFFDGMENSSRCLESEVDIFAECVYQYTRNQTVQEIVRPLEEAEERVFSHSQDGVDLCFTFDGRNSGVGSIAFDQVRVVTFGPQILDLGQIDLYGIGFLAPDNSNIFQTSGEEKFSCRGWSRTFGDKDVWVEHDFRVENGEIDVITSFESFGQESEIAECFFVICEGVMVDEKLVKAGSLDRFRGVARSLVLLSGEEKINFFLQSEVIVSIIPLAGGPHFWGATFLIAFEPEDLKKKLHLTLSKENSV